MKTVTVQDLLSIQALSEVPQDQLEWFIDHSEHYTLEEGQFLSHLGDDVKGTHIVISGHVEIYRIQNNSKLIVAEIGKGSITGTLPFSRAKLAVANLQCKEETQIMTFPREKLRELIKLHYELTQALVVVMTSRVREFTELEQQNEKMMALGKLSAGLAHELNNPAAAIVRGSVSLKKHLQLQPEAFKHLISVQMTPEEIDIVNNRMFKALNNPVHPTLSMMQRSDREDDVNDWLSDQGIKDPCDMAENFVEFDFTIPILDEIRNLVRPEDLEPMLTWININFTTQRMVADIQESSKRIADLVGSVKTFTHMDRGSNKEFVDIHVGIRNTLIMLNYKIKKAGVTLVQDFDESIPPVNAMVGELNQVWTNLIDNATDALESQTDAKLTIKTRREKEFVKVSIIDNGPGIPPEIKSKIFDPFFTTKAIGKGTGLGLDVVCRIVKQHRGTIHVTSQPGETKFVVCFPIAG